MRKDELDGESVILCVGRPVTVESALIDGCALSDALNDDGAVSEKLSHAVAEDEKDGDGL